MRIVNKIKRWWKIYWLSGRLVQMSEQAMAYTPEYNRLREELEILKVEAPDER